MKEIADGLVRAKKLENFRILNCQCNTGCLTQCVSNIAFIPNLKAIDTYESTAYAFSDADIESYLKVLKISGSIEYIRLSKRFMNHQRMFMRKDVCLAIAQNKSLKTLDIEGFNNFMGSAFEIARGIAVNAYLKNSLTEVNMKYAF